MKWFTRKQEAEEAKEAAEAFHERALKAEAERDAMTQERDRAWGEVKIKIADVETARREREDAKHKLADKIEECRAAHRMIAEVQQERDDYRRARDAAKSDLQRERAFRDQAANDRDAFRAENEALRDQLQALTAERDWMDGKLRFSADKLQEVLEIITGTEENE